MVGTRTVNSWDCSLESFQAVLSLASCSFHTRADQYSSEDSKRTSFLSVQFFPLQNFSFIGLPGILVPSSLCRDAAGLLPYSSFQCCVLEIFSRQVSWGQSLDLPLMFPLSPESLSCTAYGPVPENRRFKYLVWFFTWFRTLVLECIFCNSWNNEF